MENRDDRQPAGVREAGVLVVVVPRRSDWESVLREGWYRLPVRRAPRQAGAEYLAFYHTAAFEEERWSVRYYAAVRKVSLARRDQLLPAEPSHPRAGELYFRFDLGPLQRREPPLPSRRLRRVTFIPTTLSRLLEADDLTDLWCTPPLHERLWCELNRQGIPAEREVLLREGEHSYACDLAIPCQQGGLALHCSSEPAGEEAALHEKAPTYAALGAAGWGALHLYAGRAGELRGPLARILQEVQQRGGPL